MAQASLEGRVVAAATREPIAGAQVVLQVRGREDGLRAESDAEGLFRFPAVGPDDYQLTVEAQDYFSARYELVLKPRQAFSLLVELAPRRIEIETVEVRATYSELDPGQTGSSRLLTRRRLEELPSPLRRDVAALFENLAPGAILSHDNFVHVRGNELSLHEFINGVSFLDNAHQHFTPGLSPQIFEAVNILTGGFPAEFGNRFGGILDITTRSGRDLNGQGSVSLGVGTVLNRDAAIEYGGRAGKWGYYLFADGFQSGRFLNPPVPRELHNRGGGGRGTVQLDYTGAGDSVKLFASGGGTRFQLPATEEEELAGRDAARRLRSQTAILTWQHIFSPHLLLVTSAYERNVSDRLLATTDPVTPFGEGSRSTLTTGVKADLTYARAGHTLKTGIDAALFRLRESFRFDDREEEHEHGEHAHGQVALRVLTAPQYAPPVPFHSSSGLPEGLEQFFFRGRDVGGQLSLYLQDRFTLFRNFTVDAGARWDQLNRVGSYAQVSPRLGFAYHLPPTRSVFHFAYNRLFSPPPLEYVGLASFLGNAGDAHERVGNARPYTQNYYEVGWHQQFHPKVFLELNAYAHRGSHAFEVSEISNTRLFLPTNFDRARTRGAEISVVVRQLERLGLSGRLQYAVARVHFFGPVSGGFPAEELAAGERVSPAFDQTHTGTASLFYRASWRNFWLGFIFRYGSGTPREEEEVIGGEEVKRFRRLPQHLTADFATGITLWQREARRLELEFNVTNLSNNLYQIAKESETTPVQFAPRRVVSGRLRWRF